MNASVGDRQAWLFELLRRSPDQAPLEYHRTYLNLRTTSFSDSGAARLGAGVPVGPIDLHLGATQLFFVDLTNSATARKSALSGLEQLVNVEFSRLHRTPSHAFGRLGVEYSANLGSRKWSFISLNLGAGYLPSAANRWGLNLGVSYSYGLHGTFTSNVLGFVLSTNITTSETTRLGGTLRVTHRSRNIAEGELVENILFTVGPDLFWSTGLGELRASLLLRMSLDRNRTEKGTTFPSEFFLPDLMVSWQVGF